MRWVIEGQSAGRPVVGNFFEAVDTHGIPLDVVLVFLQSRGYVPSWLTFASTAIRAGWNYDSMLTKIRVACEDVYGREHAQVVEQKLRSVFDIPQ